MLEGLQEGLASSFGGVGSDIKAFVVEKPIQSMVIGAGVVGVTTAGIVAISKSKSKSRKKRKAKTKAGRSRDRKFRSKQKHELAYVRKKRKAGKKITRPKYKTKGSSKSKKRVGKTYFTKKGQPYKIMASGKARFIKKRKGRR